jgi:hypothetical protein
MVNVNDNRILELRAQIEKKKEKMKEVNRFSPVTNCSLEIDEERYNLNVLTVYQLTLLQIKLNSYLISARDLGVSDTFMIAGFTIQDWLTDVKGRLDILSRKDQEKQLKFMEEKLDKLLSQDKKVELELKAIADILKD